MINIAIIDPNEIFRESLKIMLEQIDGFRVILETNDCNRFKTMVDSPVQVLLIDNGIGADKQNELIADASRQGINTKSLVLTTFKEDLPTGTGRNNSILKISGKKEFETRIRLLAGECIRDTKIR
jgi:DNA-binding NarL/FixJ family response regulator